MDYSVSLEIGAGKVANNAFQLTIGQDKKNNGLANLRQGQHITGTVVSVEEQVILDFDGQKVTTSKDVLKSAVPGEKKTFEVIKASSSEIEIKLMDGTVQERRQTIKGAMVKDTDWDTVLSKKEETAKLAEKEKQSQEIKTKLEEIGTKFTEMDCLAIEKEGFSVESLSVSGLYEAINRVKSGTISVEQNSTQKTNKLTGADIVARLKEENLPDTSQNIDRINKALALSDTAAKIDDKTMKYLISKDAEASIENIYKAYYSGSTKNPEKKQELTDDEWSELETQVKSVIESAGYEINQENIKDAKWLIENNLPLTKETFSYKKELGDIKANASKEMVLDRIIEGMKSGAAPKDVTLVTQNDASLQQILTNIDFISKDAVTYAVQENVELTIKRLTSIQESISSGKISITAAVGDSSSVATADAKADTVKADTEISKLEPELNDEYIEESDRSIEETSSKNPSNSDGSSGNKEYDEARAQRQLEEIRLKMTLEVAQRLEKKGIHIETQRLEEVVEELRKLEDGYYKKLMSEADVQGTEDSLRILKSTTQSMEQLRYVPCSILGSTLSERSAQTIPDLLSEGTKLQAEVAKAGNAYEALMTVPNAEYGDSLRKAFAHMDSLLSEMKIENTEQNQRAVRILSYNQMEITQEAINQVKAYDTEVTTLMQNLHPAVTVRMIKEGINPLEMPINELNDTIDRMKEEQGISSEEKYSTYLRKLEKADAISEEERKAYIGVYRLLYNVDKSDGAALGAVIKADQEVTLSHLLTAVQTGKKGRLEATINDEFGTLTGISRNKESIAEQLSSFTDSTGQNNSEQSDKEARFEEQTQYLERILKQITDEISPEKLNKLQQSSQQPEAQSVNSANLLPTAAGTQENEGSIWESIKNVPVEKLLEQLQNIKDTQEVSEEIVTQKVQQIRELCKNSEQSIRFLNDYQMPTTPQNIMIANHILSNGESPIVKLLKQQNENSDRNSEFSLKELGELSDTINDKSSLNVAFKNLEANAKATLEQVCSEETLDNQKLIELRSIGQQMTFLRQLASKEFYQIPIETEKGITNMNLTILRGSEKAGRVSVSVSKEQLGDVRVDFTLKDQTLKGFISCDNRIGLVKLQTNAGEIEKAAKENNISLKQLDFGIQSRENDTYNYQNPETGEQSTSVGTNTERILYRMAKAIVQTVRLAEDSEAEK